MSKKIKKGTKVEVITGSYKKTRGAVVVIKGDRVAIDTLPKMKKGRKANPQRQIEAGFDMVDRLIHVSNVKPLSEGEADE